MTNNLRTPTEWLTDPEFTGTRILDYDGWSGPDWLLPIDRDEFRRRLHQCTVTMPVRTTPVNEVHAPDTDPHANCIGYAYQMVRCDRCGRKYRCIPEDDFYCTAAGDHACEPCLLSGITITDVITVLDVDDQT